MKTVYSDSTALLTNGIQVDVDYHDSPHDNSILEWWYFNGHFESTGGKTFAFFASFFRIAMNFDSYPYEFIHSLTWSLIDLEDKKYLAEAIHDSNIASKILEMMNEKKELSSVDLALKEIILKENLPAPDYLIKQNAVTAEDHLNLAYGPCRLIKNTHGHYLLDLKDVRGDIQLSVIVKPVKNAVRHGNNGIVRSSFNQEIDMLYYFIPENKIEGSLLYKAEEFEIKGNGWYDHEFSTPSDKPNVAFKHRHRSKYWIWFSIQLDNHCQLTVYQLKDKKSDKVDEVCVWIDAQGNSHTADDFSIETLKHYISKQTCACYPVSWRLHIPGLELDLNLEAAFPQQEVVTILSTPGFWEGSLKVDGTFDGNTVSGKGFAEVTTDKGWNEMNLLLDQASEEILDIIHRVIPDADDVDKINFLMTGIGHTYLNAVPPEILHEALIQPLKEMIDRRGKSWRSHLLRLLAGIAGGEPSEYDNFAAFFQIMHCSSLIIDDVEDQSPVRRGGLSCHQIYGIPLAVNSGCFGYFIGELLLRDIKISDAKSKKMYEAYFDGMRLSHGGQALDLKTFNSMLPEAFESGETKKLELYIKEVHTLKQVSLSK